MKANKHADVVLNKYVDYQARCNRIYFLKHTHHPLTVMEKLELRTLVRWYNATHNDKVRCV